MLRSKSGRPSSVWMALTQSPFEIAIALYFALYGLGSLVFSDILTPPSVDAVWQAALIVVWHVTLALGGVCTLLGRALELERLESVGLASLIFSCSFYVFALSTVAIPASIAAIGAYLCIGFGSAWRMYVIRKSLQGQEIAQNVLEELNRTNGGTDE